jgi:putative ABC transport system permease protein
LQEKDMSYSLTTLWHEKNRFLPGILAVAFSALLIALQCGLLLGLFSITSIPIDHTRADVWVSAPEVLSVDLGRPIDQGSTFAKVAAQPEVARVEPYMQGFAYWTKPGGGNELCMVIGSRLGDDYIGDVDMLTPELRSRLAEHGSIVVDESELDRLGIKGVGDYAEITGHRARVVGLTHGIKSLAGPYLFCSLYTARDFLRLNGTDMATYVLVQCHDPAQAPELVRRLRESDKITAFTAPEFSLRSRMHWLTKTKAGIALGYAAALGLLVGAVVTSQTLYAAVAAQLREYAVLRALGIPRWRMGMTVIAQSFWVGLIGVCLALPAAFALAELADRLGVRVTLPPTLILAAIAITMMMAIMSGLAALRSLRLVEPAMLLR